MHSAGSNLSTAQKCPKCIYKISKNFRVEKSGEISRKQQGIRALREDLHALRLASELADLRAADANLLSRNARVYLVHCAR